MKVAHITPVYLPYHSGMTSVVVSQCAELRRRGHEVDVISAIGDGGGDSNVRHVRPLLKFGNGAWVPHMFKYLKGYDVVHLHYPFFAGLEAVLLAKSLGYIKKLVVYYHFDHRVAGVFAPIARVYERVLLPAVLRAADTVMVSTMDYARSSRLKKYVSEKDFENKVVEVPIGIDVDRFRTGGSRTARTESLRRELGVAKEEKVVLFVGGMDRAHYFKGVEVLLRAFARLSQNVRLVLVGEGELRKGYEVHAQELGIQDRVHFAGRVSDAELPSYYAAADVSVLPSINGAEAFGVVLLEAQAMGTPVIATDLPGVRGVVGDSGLVVKVGDEQDLQDALHSILSDLEVWRGKKEEIVGRVENRYDMKVIGQKIEGVYQS